MSEENADSSITQPIDGNAEYWNPESHGTSWAQVKLAFKRDWEQTKADALVFTSTLDQIEHLYEQVRVTHTGF